MTLDTTTSSNTNNAIILAIGIGTATLSPLSFEADFTPSLSLDNLYYQPFENHTWDNNELYPLDNFEQIQILQKIKVLKSFSSAIVENSQSLDNETIEIINKNFWDWI